MRDFKAVVFVGATLSLLAVVPALAQQEMIVEEKEFVTPDHLQLFAWLFSPPEPKKAPLIVALPMRGRTHQGFDLFVETLTRHVKADTTGQVVWPYVLSFDLRGHGKSTVRRGRWFNYKTMPKSETMKTPMDIAQMVKVIVADTTYRIDPEQIIVFGASVGGNAGMLATQHLSGVKKVVLLSPGSDYLGLIPDEAIEAFSGDILIYVGEGDAYSKGSSERLMKLNKEHCTLRVVPGELHGTDIINFNRKAMAEIITWILKD